MATPNLTRAGVEAAPPLEFPDRKTSRQDLTITIKATLDGFPVELVFNGGIEQLQGIARRLRELGAEPYVDMVKPPIAPQNGAQRVKAQTVEPIYQPDGTPCCPVHKRALKQGNWGPFCSAKDRESGEYCRLKFES